MRLEDMTPEDWQHFNADTHRAIDDLNRTAEQERTAAQRDAAFDLLKRLAEWDHMQTAGDGPYWKAEIAKVLA